jgi:dsDNA-specific endonuclease/ATPase MutS2
MVSEEELAGYERELKRINDMIRNSEDEEYSLLEQRQSIEYELEKHVPWLERVNKKLDNLLFLRLNLYRDRIEWERTIWRAKQHRRMLVIHDDTQTNTEYDESGNAEAGM